MGLYSLFLRYNIVSQYSYTTQVATLLTCRDISLTLTISCRIITSGSKPRNYHVSLQFHVVFDDEFSTVPFTREVTIPLSLIDLVQRNSKCFAPENIDLKDNWFTPYLEEDPKETPTHVPRYTPENNRTFITSLHPIQQI